ncbi:extracellular GDSL-like lipase/acylhydrolase [Marasmius fiardii PR-910]|nr:extracellular GDSL-like lipase/acylhydrolase [Marasmius fiardii PR-910]
MVNISLYCIGAVLLQSFYASGGVNAITPDPANGRWVDTWASMPQLTETANLPPSPFTQFKNTTIRQTVRVTSSAKQLRIRLSNAFGTIDLPITAATIALPAITNGTVSSGAGTGASAIQANTLQPLTFSGNSSIIIPNGALAVSDPVDFAVVPGMTVAVTLFLQEGQASSAITSHPGSRTTSWFVNGNHVTAGEVKGLTGGTSIEHWYFLSAVEAWSPKEAKALAIIGDSITDGRGSTTNGNDRWPDQLFTRTQSNPSTKSITIINQAAGGNRILADGLGPNVFGRVERDVLSHSGVGYAMIFEGVNDIGGSTPATINAITDRVIQAYRQISVRIHALGIPFFGATITPFFGSADYTAQNESARKRINEWVRTTGLEEGVFDAVVDFDLATRDNAAGGNVERLNPAFDSGDGLHLNPAGYKAMAGTFDLGLFDKFGDGVGGFQ